MRELLETISNYSVELVLNKIIIVCLLSKLRGLANSSRVLKQKFSMKEIMVLVYKIR